MATAVPLHVAPTLRRPVKQRSRLLRRSGPPHTRVDFAHPSEREFARFLDYYRIRWAYEPVSFPLGFHEDRVTEMFTPDFYLPEHQLYVELTTMKQSLVTHKNRKVRLLRELYPDVNVRLLYRKDYQQLLVHAGYERPDLQQLPAADLQQVLISPVELQARVKAIGRRISRDYRGQGVLLVGLLKGITFFLADLSRNISIPLGIDYLSLARYAGAQPADRVRIVRDIDAQIEGRNVIVVDDIVSTGLTLDYVLRELAARRPRALEVAALLERPNRRIAQVPVRYVGFQIPNDYVVGYGLDYHELYRNLPFICTLKTPALQLVQ